MALTITKHIILRDDLAQKISDIASKHDLSSAEIVNRILTAVDLDTIETSISFRITELVPTPSPDKDSTPTLKPRRRIIRKVSSSKSIFP